MAPSAVIIDRPLAVNKDRIVLVVVASRRAVDPDIQGRADYGRGTHEDFASGWIVYASASGKRRRQEDDHRSGVEDGSAHGEELHTLLIIPAPGVCQIGVLTLGTLGKAERDPSDLLATGSGWAI
jgi:hypothetical protein